MLLAGGAAGACGSGGSGGKADLVMTAGGTHSCVLVDGEVSCWGNNFYGQVGTDNLTDFIHTKTVPVEIGEVVVDVAAGYNHTCALTESGTVYCWGVNKFGQLGGGTRVEFSRTPVQVKGLDEVVALGAGEFHSCAVLDNGGVRCWGRNESGQLGNGRFGYDEDAFEPEKVGGLRDVVLVEGGAAHTCAVTNAGAVYCWGANNHGSLGDGTDIDQTRPVQVHGLPEPARSVTLGEGFTCALLEGGSVYCWGVNNNGQLGRAVFAQDGGLNPTPEEVQSMDDEVVALASGASHTCAVTPAQEVFCWGSSDYGQVGTIAGHTCFLLADPCQLTPALVELLREDERPVSIAGGFDHSCVLYGDGEAMCWGANGVGQLGDGTAADSLDPVVVISSKSAPAE